MGCNLCKRCPRASICLPSHSAKSTDLEFNSRILKRGEHLFYQGQASRHLYILRAGALKSYTTTPNGDEFIMGFYFPADLFGWEAIDDQQRSISIVALDQSDICIIPTDKLFLMTQQTSTFGNRLLQMISRRIQQDNVALLRTTAQQRVATFLLQLAMRYEELGFSKKCLRLLMTHHDIANYLRITPSTISRIFNRWEKGELIAIKNHVIELLDSANLKMIADND